MDKKCVNKRSFIKKGLDVMTLSNIQTIDLFSWKILDVQKSTMKETLKATKKQ